MNWNTSARLHRSPVIIFAVSFVYFSLHSAVAAMPAVSKTNNYCDLYLSRLVHEVGLIVESPHLKAVVRKAGEVSEHRPRVTLIYGEHGTGKSSIARLLHLAMKNTRNANGAVTVRSGELVQIFPGSMSDELAATEIFGYVKGAYTGANLLREGAIERANNGTLFIDDFQDIGEHLQRLLLDFLQTGKYRKVGSDETSFSNARVVIGTNQNLKSLMQSGKLRQDLYYRITSGAVIMIPPLRNRPQDIVPIVQNLISEFNREHNTELSNELLPEVVQALTKYAWPGNVRELEGVVARWLMASNSNEPRNKSLSSRYLEFDLFPEEPDFKTLTVRMEKQPLADTLQNISDNLILWALHQTDFNLAAAGRLLEIPSSTINRYRDQLLKSPALSADDRKRLEQTIRAAP